ncbi:gamma-glutamyl-gamma-aminobutyrate hydrolase family protein [uncultured Ferrovibrio sp.]|jgi:putative glutamine amidotransferase|uniref:gamma-glutamyl-gamma-aminobutyrate hydrolase family protein n=1 Tax=uncultured Ferrovibrio sp. TaxID=1576913 RepID=UPI0026227597|nr:gamma-glutamyl-gamma-aminobutyrate hydrolase family protein [uncultured Ferrovibrio sp.]
MSKAKSAPLIGITLDSEEPGGYSKFPWYALRQNYCSAVSAKGGVPLVLPHEPGAVESYLDLLDGLIVTGGNFDVDPALFGATAKHATVKTKDARTQFEWAITKGMLERNKPVFGICGGQQLLNVVLGGTLIQHIPDAVENALAHEQPNPRDQAGHSVHIAKGTLLHRIVGAEELPVNSAHHQAVEKVAPGAISDAVAPDGVIEGIEHPDYRFCLGVQWHPEFLISQGDEKLFAAFVAAAAQ